MKETNTNDTKYFCKWHLSETIITNKYSINTDLLYILLIFKQNNKLLCICKLSTLMYIYTNIVINFQIEILFLACNVILLDRDDNKDLRSFFIISMYYNIRSLSPLVLNW